MSTQTKSFEDLKALAEAVYEKARDMDRDHAVLAILETIAAVYSDGQRETLDLVEERLRS
jgi:hemoglobin-like flavoprotein